MQKKAFCTLLTAAFNRWNDERNVNVNQSNNDWNGNWWFAGLANFFFLSYFYGRVLFILFFFYVQTDGIHAVMSTGFCRTVFKNMSEVRAASGADSLNPQHVMRIVGYLFYSARQSLVKRRPARAGIKFCGRIKEGIAADYACIRPVGPGMQ